LATSRKRSSFALDHHINERSKGGVDTIRQTPTPVPGMKYPIFAVALKLIPFRPSFDEFST
jgi:hypothetical protein